MSALVSRAHSATCSMTSSQMAGDIRDPVWLTTRSRAATPTAARLWCGLLSLLPSPLSPLHLLRPLSYLPASALVHRS